MNTKNTAIAGIAEGIVLLTAMFVFGKIAGVAAPFDIAAIALPEACG